MTIEEMKARKTELGYTNEMIADLSGVPLGTVQKIFAGETKSPRYDTVQKLSKVLEHLPQNSPMHVSEVNTAYGNEYRAYSDKRRPIVTASLNLRAPRKVIGIADGKYKMPPEEMFFDDEITEMFEGL